MFQLHIDKKPPTTVTKVTVYDLIIIGGGPAGLNAALYAKRKGLNVLLLAKEIGGQLHNTSIVDNYLGFKEIEGKDLSNTFLHHLETLSVPIMTNITVKNLAYQKDIFTIQVSASQSYQARTVLLTTGGAPRKLNIPGEKEYQNKGVSYCTTCDAPFFKGKHVIVAGGGNSAAEAIIDLAAWASKTTLVHRSEWRADDIILQKVKTIPNLTIHLQTQITRIYGDDFMKGINVFDKVTGKESSILADGIFIEIGTIPNSDLVKGLATLNEIGEVIVDSNQMTSFPGLFAAGDVTASPHKQIVTSIAQGAIAALGVTQYLNLKENKI
ncbi:MAG: FAD-dependent oxidoreductase [Bacilli bacterium]|nr:FAD-dependent oxidoreductase [Bacilli bacterium]